MWSFMKEPQSALKRVNLSPHEKLWLMLARISPHLSPTFETSSGSGPCADEGEDLHPHSPSSYDRIYCKVSEVVVVASIAS